MSARSPESDRRRIPVRSRGSRAGATGYLIGLLVASFLSTGCDPATGRSGGDLASGVGGEEIAARVAAAARSSAAEAYEEALAERDPLIQHMLLASVYARADAGNIQALSDVFAADADHRNGPQARVIGALWGRIDPEAGLADTLAWERPLVREFASRALMNAAVAEGRGAELIQILDRLESELAAGSLQTGQVALVEALFEQRHYELGLEFVEGLDADEELLTALVGKGVLAGGKGEEGEALLQWAAERLEADGDRSDAEVELSIFLMKLLIRADHERGRAWFEEHVAGTRASDRGLEVLTDSEWARSNPQKAFDYVRSRPTMEPIARGARALAYHWLRNDPDTARPTLLKAANEDARMESVILPLVQYMMVMEVAASMELAQRISDPEEKYAALKQGLMRWARMDPAAVDAYVQRYPVSPDLRRSIAVAKSLSGTKRARVEGGGEAASGSAVTGEEG